MNPGDLVEFMCIGAGRHDNPPYANDGSWRLGLLVKYDKSIFTSGNVIETVKILYMGELFTIPVEQMRNFENKRFGDF